MLKKILIPIFTLAVTLVHAQEYKIEKITKNDFQEKVYANDSTAVAVIDYKIGSTYFVVAGNTYNVVTETKTRLTILKKEGYDFATVKIPLYRKLSDRETLNVSNAFTYNLVNGEVEKTKLKGDGEFFEKVEGNHYLASFTMPNVKEGSIIEYTTKISSPFFTYIPEWYFQYGIPVKFSEFSLKIPEGLFFYKYIKGSEKINQLTIGDKYVFKAKDIPALKAEGYVSNLNNYRSSITHSFSGYRQKDGSAKMYAGSWEDVIKQINDRETFGPHLKKADFEKEFVNTLIGDKKSQDDKTKVIVDYVKNNFNWNEEIGISAEKSLKEIFKAKSGNAAEINLLTIAMLRSANVQAYPVLLATRSKGISYMPHPEAFNNVIIGVEDGSKTYLYDATDKLSNKDILPMHNLNWIGRMVRNDGSSKDVLLEPKIESKYNVNAYLDLNPESGIITGTLRRNYNNYEAYFFRNKFKNLNNDKISEKLAEMYKIQVDSLNINNLTDVDANIEEYIKFTRENAFDKIGDKIYITPGFIFSMRENPFKLDKRTYPIDFLYPNKNSYTLTFNIPAGYAVDFVPKARKVQTGSNSVNARWVINQDDKRIQVKWNLDYNTAYADANEYQDIKAVFEELVKFMDEKIVLKKI